MSAHLWLQRSDASAIRTPHTPTARARPPAPTQEVPAVYKVRVVWIFCALQLNSVTQPPGRLHRAHPRAREQQHTAQRVSARRARTRGACAATRARSERERDAARRETTRPRANLASLYNTSTKQLACRHNSKRTCARPRALLLSRCLHYSFHNNLIGPSSSHASDPSLE